MAPIAPMASMSSNEDPGLLAPASTITRRRSRSLSPRPEYRQRSSTQVAREWEAYILQIREQKNRIQETYTRSSIATTVGTDLTLDGYIDGSRSTLGFASTSSVPIVSVENLSSRSSLADSRSSIRAGMSLSSSMLPLFPPAQRNDSGIESSSHPLHEYRHRILRRDSDDSNTHTLSDTESGVGGDRPSTPPQQVGPTASRLSSNDEEVFGSSNVPQKGFPKAGRLFQLLLKRANQNIANNRKPPRQPPAARRLSSTGDEHDSHISHNASLNVPNQAGRRVPIYRGPSTESNASNSSTSTTATDKLLSGVTASGVRNRRISSRKTIQCSAEDITAHPSRSLPEYEDYQGNGNASRKGGRRLQRTMTGITKRWRNALQAVQTEARRRNSQQSEDEAGSQEDATNPGSPSVESPKQPAQNGLKRDRTFTSIWDKIKEINLSYYYLERIFGMKWTKRFHRRSFGLFATMYFLSAILQIAFFWNRHSIIKLSLVTLNACAFAIGYPLIKMFACGHEWDSLLRLAWISHPKETRRVFRNGMLLWVVLTGLGISIHSFYHAKTFQTATVIRSVVKMTFYHEWVDNEDLVETFAHAVFSIAQIGFWNFALVLHMISCSLFVLTIREYDRELEGSKRCGQFEVKLAMDRHTALVDMLKRIGRRMEKALSFKMLYDWIYIITNLTLVAQLENAHINIALVGYEITRHLLVLLPMCSVTMSMDAVVTEANSMRAALYSKDPSSESKLDSFLLYLLTAPRSYSLAGFQVELRTVIEYFIAAYSIATYFLRDSIDQLINRPDADAGALIVT